MATREKEYIRRLRALGYEPSVAGMDEGDIEYELSRMGQSRQEEQRPAQQLVYRPVDPGLAARLFRQMGQPYDPQAIGGEGSFYIGGRGNGDEDVKTSAPQGRERQSDEPYNPWARTWELNWDKDGNVLAAGPRTMEYRPGRDGVVKPVLYASEVTSGQDGGVEKDGSRDNANGGWGDLRGVKEVPAGIVGKETESTSTQNADIFGSIKNVINVKKFWGEVYQEARETQKLGHEEAVRKANEAAILYTGYLGGAAVATRGVSSVTNNPHIIGLTGFLGWANADNAKNWIKGKVFEPYNPKWDGTTSD